MTASCAKRPDHMSKAGVLKPRFADLLRALHDDETGALKVVDKPQTEEGICS